MHADKTINNLNRVLITLFKTYGFLVTFLGSCNTLAQSPPIPCQIFPTNNIWNTPVDKLPVHINSGLWIETIGAEKSLKGDFGSGKWPRFTGGPIGIPYVIIDNAQAAAEISFRYHHGSDPGPYPIPTDVPIEGGRQSTGDRHAILINKDNCKLYEVFALYPNNDGTWRAGSGAIFDLSSNKLRQRGWTSADAAGLPILPGLVRYEEIEKGAINHALRFTARKTQRAFVWPARHFASPLKDEKYPPMGQRFRLRADFDISGFSPRIQIILVALKKYGIILADNGAPWFLSGSPDERWNNREVAQLKKIKGRDFEAVDTSLLMLEEDSAEVKPLN